MKNLKKYIDAEIKGKQRNCYTRMYQKQQQCFIYPSPLPPRYLVTIFNNQLTCIETFSQLLQQVCYVGKLINQFKNQKHVACCYRGYLQTVRNTGTPFFMFTVAVVVHSKLKFPRAKNKNKATRPTFEGCLLISIKPT